jgi:hypothetical protein
VRRPLERTVTFPGSRQDTNLANRLTKAGAKSEVCAERNIHLGQLWILQPYGSGTMEPTQSALRPRSEVIKDFPPTRAALPGPLAALALRHMWERGT